MKPQAERLRDYLLKLVAEVYDTPERVLSGEARRAVWAFIMGAEESGDDVRQECRRYVDWLAFADRNRKTEYPPQTAETACVDIGTHYGKACAWSKHKLAKSSALKPRYNPHLRDDRPAEGIPTDAEYRQFLTDLAVAASSGHQPRDSRPVRAAEIDFRT